MNLPGQIPPFVLLKTKIDILKNGGKQTDFCQELIESKFLFVAVRVRKGIRKCHDRYFLLSLSFVVCDYVYDTHEMLQARWVKEGEIKKWNAGFKSPVISNNVKKY